MIAAGIFLILILPVSYGLARLMIWSGLADWIERKLGV